MPSPVEQAIRSASRRRTYVEAARQAGWACTAFLGGLIGLLLAGTGIFHWLWLALLAIAGVVVVVLRVRKQALPLYRVAQLVDDRFQLHDTLSTACFLQSGPAGSDSFAIQYQARQAENAAKSIRPEDAFPFAGQRAWSIAAALAAVSIGLFTARYLVTESLSLKPALVSLRVDPIIERVRELVAPQKKTTQPNARTANRNDAQEASGKETQNSGSPPEPTPPVLAANPAPNGTPAGNQGASEKNPAAGGTENSGKQGDPSSNKQDGPRDAAASSSKAPENGNKSVGSSQQPNGQQPQAKENTSANPNSSPGMMSRMKDALSSMMQKMQAASSPQQSRNGSQEPSNSKNGEQAQASSRSQQGKQGQPESQNQGSNPNESAEGQAQGQTAEKQGTSQGKSGDQSAQKGSDAHSGVGQQDGDKDIKSAEQLKAMGKLAEIIGKRSATLTGDMTVETNSGQQQLKTNYSQRVGAHADSGGEINRNQVPLAYQKYVREYMEQVRREKSNQ